MAASTDNGRSTTASSSATLFDRCEDESAPLLSKSANDSPTQRQVELRVEADYLEGRELGKELDVYVPGKANFWQTVRGLALPGA